MSLATIFSKYILKHYSFTLIKLYKTPQIFYSVFLGIYVYYETYTLKDFILDTYSIHYCVLYTCYNPEIMYIVSGMSPRLAAPGTRILSGRWRQKCQAIDGAHLIFFINFFFVLSLAVVTGSRYTL